MGLNVLGYQSHVRQHVVILPGVTKDFPISPRFSPYESLSRCEFNTLTSRQQIVEFYLLTFSRFPLRMYVCRYGHHITSHMVRVRINQVRLPILIVVS